MTKYSYKQRMRAVLDIYLQEFDSFEHFRSELRDYIDYYNNKRIKCKLKGLSPVQYLIQSQRVA